MKRDRELIAKPMMPKIVVMYGAGFARAGLTLLLKVRPVAVVLTFHTVTNVKGASLPRPRGLTSGCSSSV